MSDFHAKSVAPFAGQSHPRSANSLHACQEQISCSLAVDRSYRCTGRGSRSRSRGRGPRCRRSPGPAPPAPLASEYRDAVALPDDCGSPASPCSAAHCGWSQKLVLLPITCRGPIGKSLGKRRRESILSPEIKREVEGTFAFATNNPTST